MHCIYTRFISSINQGWIVAFSIKAFTPYRLSHQAAFVLYWNRANIHDPRNEHHNSCNLHPRRTSLTSALVQIRDGSRCFRGKWCIWEIGSWGWAHCPQLSDFGHSSCFKNTLNNNGQQNITNCWPIPWPEAAGEWPLSKNLCCCSFRCRHPADII